MSDKLTDLPELPVTTYRCRSCNNEFEAKEPDPVCRKCGGIELEELDWRRDESE